MASDLPNARPKKVLFFAELPSSLFWVNDKINFSSQLVWPDIGIKSSPIFSKSSQKRAEVVFAWNVMFFKIAQIVTMHLGYFWKNIVIKYL